MGDGKGNEKTEKGGWERKLGLENTEREKKKLRMSEIIQIEKKEREDKIQERKTGFCYGWVS